MLDDIINFFTSIFVKVFSFVRDIFYDLWEAIKNFFLDVSYAIYDVFLSIFETLVTSIPVPSSWVTSDPLSSLPAQTLYVLSEIGIVQALAIVFSAWLIRLLINFIPAAFTRV